MAKARVRTTNVEYTAPRDKPPKNPVEQVKTAGRLKHPLFPIGKSPGIVLQDTTPNKIEKWILTCPSDREFRYGTGKKAKVHTEVCGKMMSVYLEHGRHRTTVRCCFCHNETNTKAAIAAGKLVKEDLPCVQS